jgi:hypothetical protein
LERRAGFVCASTGPGNAYSVARKCACNSRGLLILDGLPLAARHATGRLSTTGGVSCVLSSTLSSIRADLRVLLGAQEDALPADLRKAIATLDEATRTVEAEAADLHADGRGANGSRCWAWSWACKTWPTNSV